MPITQSAKKAVRSTEKKRVANIRRIHTVRDTEKEIKKLIHAGKTDEAKAKLPEVYKALDKAAKMNTIKKNNASRKKSRLSAFIKKASLSK